MVSTKVSVPLLRRSPSGSLNAMRSVGASSKDCTWRSTTASCPMNSLPTSAICVRRGTWGLKIFVGIRLPSPALSECPRSAMVQTSRQRLPPQIQSCLSLLTRDGLLIAKSFVTVQSGLARAVVKSPDSELGRAPRGHGVMKAICPGDGISSGIGRICQEGPRFADVLEFLCQRDQRQGDGDGAVRRNGDGLPRSHRQGIQGGTGRTRRTVIQRVTDGKVPQGDARVCGRADAWKGRIRERYRGIMVSKR